MVFWAIMSWASQLIEQFSYIAIFLVSLLGSSMLFIPFPLDSIISFSSFVIKLNPFLVGIFAGFGSALGEITGYLIGLGSRSLVKEKKINRRTSKFVNFITKLFEKYGIWIIPLAAFIPFPFDIIGISAGIGNYDIKKFLLAVSIGRILRCILIAFAAYKIVPLISEFW